MSDNKATFRNAGSAVNFVRDGAVFRIPVSREVMDDLGMTPGSDFESYTKHGVTFYDYSKFSDAVYGEIFAHRAEAQLLAREISPPARPQWPDYSESPQQSEITAEVPRSLLDRTNTINSLESSIRDYRHHQRHAEENYKPELAKEMGEAIAGIELYRDVAERCARIDQGLEEPSARAHLESQPANPNAP